MKHFYNICQVERLEGTKVHDQVPFRRYMYVKGQCSIPWHVTYFQSFTSNFLLCVNGYFPGLRCKIKGAGRCGFGLESAMALLAGKRMAKTGIFLDSYLLYYNLRFVCLM
ncbi:hypothetical protein HanIR_Chr13g0650161 [Helianthus annuus]|nr:hypothetical protein HanIR_Chr13g0650161 [Helianthus annuus]